MFNFQNLLFNHNKEKATHSIIPSKYPERKNIPFFDTVRELCDNSVDANSTVINIVLERNEIFIIDNGIGMNKDVLKSILKNSQIIFVGCKLNGDLIQVQLNEIQ